MSIDSMIEQARQLGCSDIHFTRNIPPIVRLHGSLTPLPGGVPVLEAQIEDIAKQMLPGYTRNPIDTDFCYVNAKKERQRVNIYQQQGSAAIAIRLLNDTILPFEQLGLPAILRSLALLPRGLVLVTGPTGSGKSTTLASMIDCINTARSAHILTLEDPVEYLHPHKRCMVNQREVGKDAQSFAGALRSALREDPDVILVGEMRDQETIAAAITAAETGHFVMSTLHTTGAANTIDRIIDVFPAHQQQQMRTQLSMVLRAVITQQLMPTADGKGRVAAVEIMIANDAVSNMIRENKCHQISSVLQTGAKAGMQSMDMHLAALAKAGKITVQEAQDRCMDRGMLTRLLA